MLGQAALPPAPAVKDSGVKETEEGIPVTSDLVIQKCGACHTRDEKGNLSRISWVRATPEGWAQAIRRMVRQNGLQINAEDARAAVKYLSAQHGLAPEEAKPVMYIPEKRIIDETLIPDDNIRTACASCHAFGQPMSWRRSKADWALLQNMHVALYSQADAQYRRPATAAPGAPPRAPGTPGPVVGELALEYMAKTAPLHTAEWSAWQSRQRPARVAGKWLVAATLPGKGKFVGEMIVEPGPAEDEFKTTTTLTSVKDGTVLKRTGTSIVYGGYSWRGRANVGVGEKAAPDDMTRESRETMWVSPSLNTAEGRWFWGFYDEFGFDVKMTRVLAGPAISSVAEDALKVGAANAKVTIYGDNLPTTLTAADVHLGTGVTVKRIVSQTATKVVVEADVAPAATSGQRDVELAGATLEKAFTVYRKVDYLKVTPETSMARLGSDVHPKGYQQYDAIGFENGPDGKPNTADDIAVGPVDVTWKVDEFMAVYNDDDRDFVGKLSATALFTPASDGPNPARKFTRNNYGDVWITATAKSEKDKFGQPLTARSYLVVAVPAYQRWDQPEVSR